VLYVGMDLSRKRLDIAALDGGGGTVWVGACPPDRDGLRTLAQRFAGESVSAAIESMNGARFVHDQLELAGWDVQIADAAKTKGLAPLACKTDRIDARVLAELCWRDLVPAVWLPGPDTRAERERARFRLHLVRHRTSLKTACTRRCSPTASPAPSATCSAPAAASYSLACSCQSHGQAP
jgi:transposase